MKRHSTLLLDFGAGATVGLVVLSFVFEEVLVGFEHVLLVFQHLLVDFFPRRAGAKTLGWDPSCQVSGRDHLFFR